jgi:hypothetical protein
MLAGRVQVPFARQGMERFFDGTMSERMTQNLVLQSFDQAVTRYQPSAGVVHHSDRGGQ